MDIILFKVLAAKPKIGKKEREDFLKEIQLCKQHVQMNLPFVVDQFSETVEKMQTSAKHEIVAWIDNNQIKGDRLPMLA